MAKVNQRLWKIPGQRTKRKAWGFTAQLPCNPCPHRHPKAGAVLHPDGVRQVRQYKAEWSKEDAEKELASALLQLEPPSKATSDGGITFGQAAERYLATKSRKRSLVDDKRIIKHLKSVFGAETPLTEITASRISEYKAKRLGAVRTIGADGDAVERRLSAAGVNRPLALLRHLLRLAHDEWGELDSVPRIRIEKEPEGRLRWLMQEEAATLLEACRRGRVSKKRRNPNLADLVEFALFTGVRRGEALGLTWDRVDRARGVIRLELTKSGRRREVPLSANADAVLARRWKPEATGYVFGGRNWNSFRSAWEGALEVAGIDDFRFHDLRHNAGSRIMPSGFRASTVLLPERPDRQLIHPA
jgi:integrase